MGISEQEALTSWTPTTVAMPAAPQGNGDVASVLEDLDLSRAAEELFQIDPGAKHAAPGQSHPSNKLPWKKN